MTLKDKSSRGRIKLIIGGMGCALLLATTTGVSCDQNAQADWRQAATQAIGNGIKTIANGLIDGWISAALNAGDGPATGQ